VIKSNTPSPEISPKPASAPIKAISQLVTLLGIQKEVSLYVIESVENDLRLSVYNLVALTTEQTLFWQ
jgi:hypothetical protein